MKAETLIAPVILLVSAIVGAMDVVEDRQMGLSVQHYGPGAAISFISLLTVSWLIYRFTLGSDRVNAYGRWNGVPTLMAQGLATAIDHQFDRWRLSPAEGDVALLSLKGLALKEIAEVRQVSEKTVRQQMTAVYAKSKLRGRAELSAFFLEDLLPPTAAGELVR